jgi:hypothetical protein
MVVPPYVKITATTLKELASIELETMRSMNALQVRTSVFPFILSLITTWWKCIPNRLHLLPLSHLDDFPKRSQLTKPTVRSISTQTPATTFSRTIFYIQQTSGRDRMMFAW